MDVTIHLGRDVVAPVDYATALRELEEAVAAALKAEDLDHLLAWCRQGDVLRLPKDASPIPRDLIIPQDLDGETLVGPLSGPDGPIGVLVLAAFSPRSFTELHVEVMKVLVAPFTVALENDRVLRDMKTHQEAAEADRRSLLTKLGRQDISEAITAGDLPTAASAYLKLVQLDEDVVLSRDQQLDIANQLMSANQYSAAADAYERFIARYGKDENAPDIHLMLGLIYGRYLKQTRQAAANLEKAIEGLDDPAKVQMAKADLAALSKRK